MAKLKQDLEKESYTSDDGYTLKREWGKSPNGNNMNGRWVLRDSNMSLIDFDQYRNDLAERNNLEIR